MLGCGESEILSQTLGMNNRRRDGKLTKTVMFKAVATRADTAAVRGLVMLWMFIFLFKYFCFRILCKVSKYILFMQVKSALKVNLL